MEDKETGEVTTHHHEEERTWIEHELFKRRWSIRQFGREVKISAQHAMRVTRGEVRPSTKLCKRIARVFEMPETEVLRRAGHLSLLPSDQDERGRAEILELFRRLPRDRRKRLLQFGQFLEGLEEDEESNGEGTLPSNVDSA